MPCHVQTLPKLFILAALTCAGALTCAAQTPADELRDVLRRQAAFTEEEFAAMERGEAVVKLLPSGDKSELAFCGVLRLQGAPSTSASAFGEAVTRKNTRYVLAVGNLGTPPAPEDLQSLTLDNRDVEDLARCESGDCKVKLSAAMIGRMRSEVDWDAPDKRLRAARLYRQLLYDYVQDYFARGDEALVEYDGRAGGARRDEESRPALDSLPYVADSAPEFSAYLRDFPAAELPGVANSFQWSKIKFGLKPVVLITHTATYERERDDARQIFIATRQLYASHYIDSSLSLTLLLSVPAGGASYDTYLLYSNRSRVDVFAGAFGGAMRRVVEGEALNGLRATLQQTKQNVQARLNDGSAPASRAGDEAATTRPWAQRRFKRFLLLALLIVASILYVWLGRRYQGRGPSQP